MLAHICLGLWASVCLAGFALIASAFLPVGIVLAAMALIASLAMVITWRRGAQ